MTTYTSNDSLFRYTVDNDSNSYTVGDDDYNIIAECFNYWDSIVTPNSGFNGNHIIDVSFNISTLGTGILGGASVSTLVSLGNQEFGNTFPSKGSIIMNDLYISEMMSDIRNSGKSKYFYVLVHEIGHILGIGSVATWGLSGTPITSYVDTDGETKTYYTGTNALREYKSYLPQIASQLIGIPMEDDGGSGTANVHAEEGHEGATSSNDRYINGVFHPGLDDELMTGWLESSPTTTPLSRISLGFLEDIGYTVDYNLADEYVLSDGSWLDLSANAHCLKSIYIDGILDISGGDVKLRGADDNLIVEGDATLQGAVRLGNKVGFGVTIPQYEMDVNGNVYVDTDFTTSNDASLNNFTVSGNYSASSVNYTGGSFESGDPVLLDTSLDKRLFVRSEDMSFNGISVITTTTTTTEITGNTWNQIGESIHGETSGDESGYSVAINSDGTIVAIGAHKNDGGGNWSGQVRVYEYKEYTQSDHDNNVYYYNFRSQDPNSQTKPLIITPYTSTSPVVGTEPVVGNSYWSQMGVEIDGETTYYYLGYSVTLNSDGTIMAAGGYGADISATDSGVVRVYQYSNSAWTQLGGDITGETAGDWSGTSVALNDDGTIVAIGAYKNDGTSTNTSDIRGHVRVYQYSNSTWTQLGSDIDGEAAGDQSGYSVSLSSDGTTIAIGAIYNDNNLSNAGQVRVFKYSNSSWTQVGPDIYGESSSDNSGWSVSLSNNGIVAIGAPFDDGNSSNSGYVRIFGIGTTTTIDTTISTSYKTIASDVDNTGTFSTDLSLNNTEDQN